MKEESQLNPNMSLANIEVTFARLEVTRNSDGKNFSGVTHLGHILKHGDEAMGYDL